VDVFRVVAGRYMLGNWEAIQIEWYIINTENWKRIVVREKAERMRVCVIDVMYRGGPRRGAE